LHEPHDHRHIRGYPCGGLDQEVFAERDRKIETARTLRAAARAVKRVEEQTTTVVSTCEAKAVLA